MSDIPRVLTIAGSDSGGGAGIQADLKTFSALGVYGASVICALTAQNTREVRAIHSAPPAFIQTQLETVFDDIQIDAVKIGMLADPETVRCVASVLRRYQPQFIVLDPVMVAKSGDRLLAEEAIASLCEELIPLATLITPNLPEAAVLLGVQEADSLERMQAQLSALLALGAQSVLLKGGHLSEQGQEAERQCHDLLLHSGALYQFTSPRIDTQNTHGTGCSLSSAIAAELAKGRDLPKAVEHAKHWLNGAIEASTQLNVGQGHGPVHHFYQLW